MGMLDLSSLMAGKAGNYTVGGIVGVTLVAAAQLGFFAKQSDVMQLKSETALTYMPRAEVTQRFDELRGMMIRQGERTDKILEYLSRDR